ncbi:MAG TPA: OmpA family protein [Bacteroidia bacterium]|jgi:chemotaxis protein MotB|nr:OmpA family protein [Bacteroidia bacterium]MBP7262122.1 OmpA family protein [Bacteroidia bacterium]MBP9179800.1 OmpA family protein [Bacteroidia bacterium]MBP9723799.1 OmpA family protein [Bacteroidia bacterium]HLP34281.1 OmpA family protein [Bacteroidia bacterium]
MKIQYWLVAGMFITGCVSQKKYDALDFTKKELEKSNADCREKLDKTTADNEQLKNSNTQLNGRVQSLTVDSTELATQLNNTNQSLKELDSKFKDYSKMSEAEQKKMLTSLKELDARLSQKQRDIDAQEDKLKMSQAKITELQQVLNSKDSAVRALKANISNALLGFRDKGLTVEIKNGKVYVSLEEQLLFKSGKTDVDARGKEALLKLAEALNKEKDVNVLVEGHTDDVPMTGSTIKDNWDLSVLRATSIVKLLTVDGKVDAKRFVAAGRGEFYPIDAAKNADARRKNRRTEIILTPKLDELLQLLDSK